MSDDFEIDWPSVVKFRREVAMRFAEEEGLLGPEEAISGRVPAKLLERARERACVASLDELLVYALAKVAMDDDFGPRLVARRGSVPRGTFAD